MSAHEHFWGSLASDMFRFCVVRAQVKSPDGRLWVIARLRSSLLPFACSTGITPSTFNDLTIPTVYCLLGPLGEYAGQIGIS